MKLNMKRTPAPLAAANDAGTDGLPHGKATLNRFDVSATDVDGARDCLLHGVRATGTGLGVLAIDDEQFFDMVESDADYRAMIIEVLKLMFVQAGYDETCAALAEKAREKMMAAIVACGGIEVMTAFKHPVNMDLVPKLEKINVAYVNGLKPDWTGPANIH